MPFGFETIVFFVWLLILSFLIFRVLFYFRSLSKDLDKGNLVNLLEKVLDQEEDNVKSISEIKRRILQFEDEGRFHIQKVGLVKFNPFKEMGGQHSFVLAFLDGKDNGVIITGLHTRDRTRVYVKEVKKGKVELDLSDEERKALRLAQKV